MFTDDPVVPGSTVIKEVHILERRTAIDNVRAARGLTLASTVVKGIHVLDLRTALSSVCAAIPGACAAYADPLTPGRTVIQASHLNESRANVLALR